MTQCLAACIVKRILEMPTWARTDICESMPGLNPLSTVIVIRKLMFLHKLTTHPSNSVSQMIFFRKLFLYSSGTLNFKSGLLPDICRILCLYNLEFILDKSSYIRLIPSSFTWKRIVKTAVLGNSSQLWLIRLNEDDSFERYRKLHMSISSAVV